MNPNWHTDQRRPGAPDDEGLDDGGEIYGPAILVAVSAIMVFDDAGPFLWIALVIGVVSEALALRSQEMRRRFR